MAAKNFALEGGLVAICQQDRPLLAKIPRSTREKVFMQR
jgi:hypothetical protein